MAIVHELVAGCYNQKGIMSEGRRIQFKDIIFEALQMASQADLEGALIRLRNAERLGGDKFLLEGSFKCEKDILRIICNILAVYIGKSFEFYKFAKYRKHNEERYAYAKRLLPLLVSADQKWKLVSYNHRRFVCSQMSADTYEFKGWSSRESKDEGTHKVIRSPVKS